jgi:hypothetical protein
LHHDFELSNRVEAHVLATLAKLKLAIFFRENPNSYLPKFKALKCIFVDRTIIASVLKFFLSKFSSLQSKITSIKVLSLSQREALKLRNDWSRNQVAPKRLKEKKSSHAIVEAVTTAQRVNQNAVQQVAGRELHFPQRMITWQFEKLKSSSKR